MRLSRVILFVCLTSLGFAQTATISGKIADPATTGQNATLNFSLRGDGGNQCRVNGVAILFPYVKSYSTDTSGNVTGTIDRNDFVTCGADTASNVWRMTVVQNGAISAPCDVRITASTFNANQPTCLNVSPTSPVTAPTDTIYARLDATNTPFTGVISTVGVTNNGSITNNGNITNTGNMSGNGANSFKILNAIRVADQFTGADIGAKINAAFTDCSNACIVRVPAGSYSYSTTINVPEINGGNVALELDPGAYLTYTGAGDAILITPANAGVINSNSIRISGGQLIGTSAATSGIHLQATARNTITGIDITGFSTGAGIFCEGCINNLFLGVQSRLNRIGYKEQPISLFSSIYGNNSNTWIGGHIFVNTLFGVAHYAPPAIGSGGMANTFSGVTIEGNGGFTTLNATAAADNATCALAGMCLSANTVTVTTTVAHGFVVGQLVDQTATGTCFSGRYTVASVPTSTTYTYACVSANAHTGAGTVKGYSGNVFLEAGNNESFLGGYMEPAVNDGTTKATVYLGNSNFAPTNVNIRNVDFQSLGVVNTIDNFNGNVSVDGNREGANNTNFFNQEFAGGLINVGYNSVGSANYLVGSTPVVGSIVFDPSLKRLTYYGGQFNSTVATGTAPLTVASTTPVSNLSLGGGSGTSVKSANYSTDTNCASSAGPAVCGSAAAGAVVIAGSATTVTVNDSAVTANSEILVSRDDSLSARLSVTCNTQSSLALGTPRVTSRTAGVSFVISIDVGPTTTPMCINYSIIN